MGDTTGTIVGVSIIIVLLCGGAAVMYYRMKHKSEFNAEKNRMLDQAGFTSHIGYLPDSTYEEPILKRENDRIPDPYED